MSNSLDAYLIISLILFFLGIVGLVQRRDLIGMLISVELVLNGAGINFMAFNKYLTPDPTVGQIFTLFIMGIAAAEVAIALSIIIAVYRKYRTIKASEVSELKG